VKVKVHTNMGDVVMHPPMGAARAVHVDPHDIHMARCYWRPVPGCRLDQLVGDVWRARIDRSTHVADCLVTCADNGRMVYRDRASGIVLLDSPAVRDEILGRMSPDPRSSQGGAAA
jgi:hypothetical protein